LLTRRWTSGIPKTLLALLSVAPIRTPPTILSPTIVNSVATALRPVAVLGKQSGKATASPAATTNVAPASMTPKRRIARNAIR
jgi:hypothetical protein